MANPFAPYDLGQAKIQGSQAAQQQIKAQDMASQRRNTMAIQQSARDAATAPGGYNAANHSADLLRQGLVKESYAVRDLDLKLKSGQLKNKASQMKNVGSALSIAQKSMLQMKNMMKNGQDVTQQWNHLKQYTQQYELGKVISMPETPTPGAIDSILATVGSANMKLSGWKPGINPATKKPGFWRTDQAGNVAWAAGVGTIPKKGLSISVNGTKVQIGGDQTVGGTKLKPGQVWKRDKNGKLYVGWAPGARKKTREESATAQGLQQARSTLRDAYYGGYIVNPVNKKRYKLKGILDKNGNVNEFVVAGMTANLPGTDGRIHRNRIKDALQAKLRAETGAAAPDSEVKNLMQRFMPSSFDSDAEVIDKLNRMKNFVNGILARTDPQLYRTLRVIGLKKKGYSRAKIDQMINDEIAQGGMPGRSSDQNFDSDLDKKAAESGNLLQTDTSKMTNKQKLDYLKQLKKANKQ